MEHQWVVANSYTKLGVPRVWRRHAVEATAKSTTSEIKWLKAACGLGSEKGWGVDLFIEKKCARCLVKLGLACPLCRGKGSTGSTVSGTWNNCYPCNSTGERRV